MDIIITADLPNTHNELQLHSCTYYIYILHTTYNTLKLVARIKTRNAGPTSENF